VIGRIAVRETICSTKASAVPVVLSRSWVASRANSHNVIAEIAIPVSALALRIASRAFLDNFDGSLASQSKTWVSSKLEKLRD
jgi:hypothetical protein